MLNWVKSIKITLFLSWETTENGYRKTDLKAARSEMSM